MLREDSFTFVWMIAELSLKMQLKIMIGIANAGLSRLRVDILQSSVARDAGITTFSTHDIIGAVTWLAK